MEVSKLYSDKNYCIEELQEARKIFTNKNLFTIEVSEQLQKAIGLMYLYCPENMQDLVLTHLEEVQMRSTYVHGFIF